MRVGSLVVAVLAGAMAVSAAELSPLERLGREVYTKGLGANTEIVALLGDGQTRIAAPVMPCASCHGADGKGREEGGIIPSDITSASLAVAHDDGARGGRKRGPYTDRLIKRAVTLGVDSAGNPLGPTMPRYQMSLGDMNALLAYLKKLGDLRDPGLEPDAIRIGVILPPRDHLGGVAEAVRNVLRAFASARNSTGLLFDRRIDLVFCDTEGSPAARAAAAAAFIKREQPFALVSSFTDGADDELAAVAEENGIPLLATISSHAQSSSASRRYVRDLVAGVADQTRALGQFITRRLPKARVAILYGRDAHEKAIADVVAGELKTAGIPSTVSESTMPPRALKAGGIDTILYVGEPEELTALAAARRELDWRPTILVSSALMHPDALDRSPTAAPIYIALPIGPGDQTAEAVASWRKLGTDDSQHQPAQFAALASAQLLIAALQRAGRDLTRDKLLAALDTISALETGLVPPLTFTSTRHVGSTGAYVVNLQGGEDEVVWIDPG
jgi:ABC-type branched-subunit amino acid transport system substrate-binding protein